MKHYCASSLIAATVGAPRDRGPVARARIPLHEPARARVVGCRPVAARHCAAAGRRDAGDAGSPAGRRKPPGLHDVGPGTRAERPGECSPRRRDDIGGHEFLPAQQPCHPVPQTPDCGARGNPRHWGKNQKPTTASPHSTIAPEPGKSEADQSRSCCPTVWPANHCRAPLAVCVRGAPRLRTTYLSGLDPLRQHMTKPGRGRTPCQGQPWRKRCKRRVRQRANPRRPQTQRITSSGSFRRRGLVWEPSGLQPFDNQLTLGVE